MTAQRKRYAVAVVAAVLVLGFVFVVFGERNKASTSRPNYCKLIGEQSATDLVDQVALHPEAAQTAAALGLPNWKHAPEAVRDNLRATAAALRAGDLNAAHEAAAAVDQQTPAICG